MPKELEKTGGATNFHKANQILHDLKTALLANGLCLSSHKELVKSVQVKS